MKYCSKCGTQNVDEAQFCVQCQSRFIRKFNLNLGIYILGIANGLASVILGIITFTLSSSPKDLIYILTEEIGEAPDEVAENIINLFTSPVKVFSFGFGSLLIILGLFIILYFGEKLNRKK